ncbi:hypothetical protein OROMI_033191 [Orobanche minor]
MFEVPLCFKLCKASLHLPTEIFLSALVRHGDISLEVWGMKSETGEWKKMLPDIDLGAQKLKLQQLNSTGGGKADLVPIFFVLYCTTSRICVSNDQARRAIILLKPLADEKHEKMKEEMIGDW